MIRFNETSTALTAKQIEVERTIAQAKRIQARIDDMIEQDELDRMIGQQA